MANNSARVVGPAVAGGMLMVLGVAAVYASNLLLLVISIALLATWQRPATAAKRSGSFLAELRAGMLHCARDREYRVILSRVVLFFVAASSVHALLPVLVQQPGAFGLSWGAYGIGAVSGAVLFPYMSRAYRPPDHLTIGIVCHGICLGCLVLAPNDMLRLPILLILGVFWFQCMCAAQVGIQGALPDLMRARGMGVFTMIAMACFGLGAPLWGAVAKATSPPTAILCATALSLVALAATFRLRFSTSMPETAS
jgi:predicted MFS family arabinose efflux permease